MDLCLSEEPTALSRKAGCSCLKMMSRISSLRAVATHSRPAFRPAVAHSRGFGACAPAPCAPRNAARSFLFLHSSVRRPRPNRWLADPLCPRPLVRVAAGASRIQSWATPNGLEPKEQQDIYVGTEDDWDNSACANTDAHAHTYIPEILGGGHLARAALPPRA